jgi:hypothetical protein
MIMKLETRANRPTGGIAKQISSTRAIKISTSMINNYRGSCLPESRCRASHTRTQSTWITMRHPPTILFLSRTAASISRLMDCVGPRKSSITARKNDGLLQLLSTTCSQTGSQSQTRTSRKIQPSSLQLLQEGIRLSLLLFWASASSMRVR